MENPDVSFKRNDFIFLCLLAAILLILYLPVLNFEFLYDDYPRLVRDPILSSESCSLNNIKSVMREATFPGDLYRPVTSLSFLVSRCLNGALSPRSLHLENLILHFLCVICGMLFLKRFNIDWFLPVLIWSVHPLLVEPVANIAVRGELLAFIFGILACLAAHAGQPLIVFPLLLISGLSKESGIAFCLAAAFGALVQNWKRGKSTAAVAVLAGSLLLLFRYIALHGNIFTNTYPGVAVENPLLTENISLYVRIFTPFWLIGSYIAWIIAPLNLSIDYSRGFQGFMQNFSSEIGYRYLFLTAIFIFISIWKRKNAPLFFSTVFLIMLLPVLQILAPIGVFRAERLAYGASFFLVVFLFLFIPRKYVVFICLPISLALALLTYQRLPFYKNDRVFMKQLYLFAPESPKALVMSAKELNYQKASDQMVENLLLKAYSLEPRYLDTLNSLSGFYSAVGKQAQSEHFQTLAKNIVETSNSDK